MLRNDIESATGESLALNTVKRLTGVIPYSGSPRRSTLDILARYMGLDTWEALREAIANDTVPKRKLKPLLHQPVDSRLLLEGKEGQSIQMRHLGGGKYRVENVQGDKPLRPDDILDIVRLGQDTPFGILSGYPLPDE